MVKGKTIVVTGGNGFIGKNLVNKLKELEAKVHVLDKGSENSIDITDSESVKDFLNSVKPDYIFHLAGVLGKSGEEVMKINYEGTKNLLDSYSSYEKFIFVSTSEFYFGNNPPFKEDMEVNATTPYAKAKRESELYCFDLIKEGKPIVILRPSIVYGPGQAPGMFIPSLINKCLKGESFDMTLGEQTRDFIYISDLVDLFVAVAVNDNATGEVFNAGVGKAISLRKVVELVRDISGTDSVINFGALPYRENEIMEYYHDISKSETVLGWKPKVPLEEGFKLTIESYKLPQPF